MSDEQTTCDVNTTGVCGAHDVMVERRKHDREVLDGALKELPTVVKNQTRVLAMMTLFVLILTGSFVYTRDGQATSSAADKATNARVNVLVTQVSKLTTNLVVMDNNRKRDKEEIIQQIKKLNKQIEALNKKKGKG